MQYYENTFRKLYVIENKKINDTNFYAKVKLSPYAKGQAITVANTLRRVLLNELDCIGIQSVQIQGVSHEFTVKPGIRESIPEILSNLRKLIFRRCDNQSQLTSQEEVPNLDISRGYIENHVKTNSDLSNKQRQLVGEEAPTNEKSDTFLEDTHSIANQDFNIDNHTIVTFCSKTEPGRLYASDIHLPNDIQCVAPKQNIATLISTHASLDMKIVLTRSKQYAHTLPHNNMNTSASSYLNQSFEVAPQKTETSKQAPEDMRYTSENKGKAPHQNQFGESAVGIAAANNKSTSNTEFSHTEKALQLPHLNTIAAAEKETKSDSFIKELSPYTNTTEPFLPVDTVFNPVRRVNYSIHQEVYQNTKQESIFLEIWTNGSLYPIESLARTSLVLRQMFQPFSF